MCARRAVPVLAAIVLGVGAQVAGAAPDCISSWETSGALVVGATELRGVAADGQGNLYVTDMAGHRLIKYRRDGIALACWGAPGAGAGEFRGPAAVAVDGAARVFVADCYNHRVQAFTADGVFLREWGRRGSAPGEFDHPSGIAVDDGGLVYVADTGNHRIQMFTGEGVLVAAWGTGAGEGERGGGGGRGEDVEVPPDGDVRGPGLLGTEIEVLGGPRAVAVGPDGAVYVLEDAQVRKFSAEGRPLTAWDVPGSGLGGLAAPEGLAVGPGEMIYVAALDGAGIRIYTPNGYPVEEWSAVVRRGDEGGGRPDDHYERPPDVSGVRATADAPGALAAPRAVAADDRGHLYVTDSRHGAVLEFAYPSRPWRAVCDLDPRAFGCGVVVRSGEPLTMAVLGAPTNPTCEIDIASLVLCEGGVPMSCSLEDVCTCTAGQDPESMPGADGCPELLLCFCADQVLDAAGVDGTSMQGEATLIGAHRDGTPFWGAAPVTATRGAWDGPGGRPPDHFRQLAFTVPVTSRVTVRVYDVAGRLVRTLEDGYRAAGEYRVPWDAEGLPSGVYFARIRVADRVEARKVVILP